MCAATQLRARVEQEKIPCSVGVFRLPGFQAGLPEGGCLLVAQDSGDGYPVEFAGLRDGSDLFGGGNNTGEHGLGDSQRRAQLSVPLQRVKVHQHGAGSVGDVRAVYIPLGEPPHQPGINGAKRQLTGVCPCPCSRNIVEDPGDFRAGEVGGHWQPGSFEKMRIELGADV